MSICKKIWEFFFEIVAGLFALVIVAPIILILSIMKCTLLTISFLDHSYLKEIGVTFEDTMKELL